MPYMFPYPLLNHPHQPTYFAVLSGVPKLVNNTNKVIEIEEEEEEEKRGSEMPRK